VSLASTKPQLSEAPTAERQSRAVKALPLASSPALIVSDNNGQGLLLPPFLFPASSSTKPYAALRGT